jgi:hypothetical protein
MMAQAQKFVAVRQLEDIHHELGSDFCHALEALTREIVETTRGTQQASPRHYAEIREVKALISYLKYPDPTEPVRLEELAWALRKITEPAPASLKPHVSIATKAAQMLGIELSHVHAIPPDLGRRIGNALLLKNGGKALSALASAL